MHQLVRSASNILVHLGFNVRYHDKKLLVRMPSGSEIVVETADTQARGRHKARPKWAVVRAPGSGFGALTVFPTKDPEKWGLGVAKNVMTMATRLAFRSAESGEALPSSPLPSA